MTSPSHIASLALAPDRHWRLMGGAAISRCALTLCRHGAALIKVGPIKVLPSEAAVTVTVGPIKVGSGLAQRSARLKEPVPQGREAEGGALWLRDGTEAAVSTYTKETHRPRRVVLEKRIVHPICEHHELLAELERLAHAPRDGPPLLECRRPGDAIAGAAAAR